MNFVELGNKQELRFILYRHLYVKIIIVLGVGFVTNSSIFNNTSMLSDSYVPDIKDRTNSAN